MQARDRRFYITELRNDQCYCERPKKPGFSFCYRCYKALPADMQKDLYQQMGQGYEEAYNDAVIYLSQEVL